MSISNYLENKILDKVLRSIDFTVTTVYVSLHDDPPGETGANEVSGGSYARQSAAFDAASGGLADNTSAIDFTDMPAVTVTHVGLWDASTSGNFLWGGPLGGASDTFVAESTDDTFTAKAHGLSDDDKVELEGDNLPTGVSEGTIYYVVNSTTDTFELSATEGGSAINLTTDGAGVVRYVNAKTTNSGDTFQVGAGDLDVSIN